ncbi:MAG: transposase [Rikenellaceae bacterium]
MLAIKVHAANTHDSKSALGVIEQLRWKSERMRNIYADGGYRGELVDNVKERI